MRNLLEQLKYHLEPSMIDQYGLQGSKDIASAIMSTEIPIAYLGNIYIIFNSLAKAHSGPPSLTTLGDRQSWIDHHVSNARIAVSELLSW